MGKTLVLFLVFKRMAFRLLRIPERNGLRDEEHKGLLQRQLRLSVTPGKIPQQLDRHASFCGW